MSARPPKADVRHRSCSVAEVQKAAVSRCSIGAALKRRGPSTKMSPAQRRVPRAVTVLAILKIAEVTRARSSNFTTQHRMPSAITSAASGRPGGTLLCGDSGGLNAVSPCYDVAAQQFCQILGAPVLWHRRTRPEVLHSLAHGRRVKHLGRRLVEAPHNRLRRSPWEEKSVPAVDGHFRQALLASGRKIWQRARAAGRQIGDCLDCVAPNLR